MALNKKIINFETKAQFQSANGINKTTIQQSLSDCVNVANVGKCIGNIPWRSIVTIQDTHEIWTHGVYIGGYIDNNTIYLGGKSLNLQTFGNSNYVTLNTVQTITANKTFTGSVEFKGSTTASAIVTDNNSNIVFDTLNNIVYAGDKSLLIATLKNGGNIYGTLTAIPNNGLYYNNNKLLTSNDAFSDLSSNKEYLISITIGDVTKRLSSSIVKTNLGLGQLAFVNSLTYADVGASPNNHTHAITINGISKSLTTSGTIDLGSYLPLNGGTMTGQLKWANSTSLPEQTSPQYFICIDAFADGGTTKWASKANTLKALTGLTSTAIGNSNEPVYWNGTAFIKANAYPTKPSWNYDDKYLQLSGGTMTGSITFANTSPLLWNSGSYHQRIFITDDSTDDTAVFTFQQSTDSGINWNNLMTIRDNGKVIANTFIGALSGNADTASKWKIARTITLTGSVTGSVSIDGSGDVSLVTTTNHTHSYLPISGGTMTGNIILKGGTSADMTYEGNLHPYIRFDNSDSTQNVSLIFTDYDTYRSPAGIKLIGNQGDEWFEVPNIYATNLYGNGFFKNGSSNSYVLLGGGDHKALSDFSMAHEHPYLPLTGGTLTGPIEINSTISGNYNEGLRITRATNNWAGITFGSTGLSGAPTNGWFVATNPDNQFIISPGSSSNTTGLTLNKDGDILWRNNKLLHSGNVTISNYVTLNTTQTITGLKIFTGGVQFKGSNEAHAIVTDNDANLVFDTINNQVYTGDTSLLLASFRNGGNIYGQLTAIPNEVTGLYYNSYRLLTNLDFTDVFSTTEYPVNVTIGNITRKISGSVLKTSLGLGNLAFRNNLLQSDIPLLDASIIVSGEFPNSRIQNPQITIAGKVVTLGSEITANELLTLLNLTSAMHFVGISTTDPKTSGATVSGVTTWRAGDIVLYNTKEYILTSNTNSKDNWTELGDESSYALKNHTHDYLPLTGGTINGNLIVNGNTTFKGSTSYSAIVTDGGSNIVFDTLNNIVYTGDTLLLLASFKNGGTTYGTLTAAPNQPTGLYYNGYKIITTNDFIDLFDDLYSNTEYLINIVIGGVTKRITTSTIKTNLGLGQLAFKNTLSYLDVGAAAQNHTHNYLSLSGGTLTGILNLLGGQYTDSANTGALNLSNSDIYGVNSIKFADLCDGPAEGLQWYRDSTHVDTIWVKNGVIYFTPNREWSTSGTSYTVYHSGNLSVSNLVTINTTQTITGSKLFTGSVEFRGSNAAAAIVTDNDANLVFDTLNNQVYAGDTSLLLATFKNGGTIYGTLTAIPNEEQGLYYNNHRLLTADNAFVDLYSNSEYLVVVSIGNVIKKLTTSSIKSNLGLGQLAYKNSLTYTDVNAAASNHTHAYLPLSGGTVTGQLYLTGLDEGSSDVTDNTEILTSYASNNGFADSNAVGRVYRRDAICIYNYIKNKLSNVYAPASHTHSYLPLSGGTISGNLTVSSTLTVNTIVGKISIAGGSYSWYSIQQYNSSDTNPSYYSANCAIINITSYAGWQPWIRAVDNEKASWVIGQYTNNLHIGRIPKSNTTNALTYSWIFQNNGTFVSSGSIYAPHFYENSDIRYKEILNNLTTTTNDIATLPIFNFKWIENNSISTGTSAQAVQEILPYIVSGTDKLTLNYGVLGTIAGITACKELITQKSEIELLKDRVEQLEQQLKMYNVK